MKPSRAGRLFVISSPSGGGKTTVVRALLQRVHSLRRSISMTTRARRPGERHGRDYYFVSEEAFAQLRESGQLLEWALVHGAWYGTPKAPVERAITRGLDLVLSIDVQGAAQVRRRLAEYAVLVFLVPPSIEHLKARLMKRRTDAPDAIARRLKEAERELQHVRAYDYAVVNDQLERAIKQLQAIIVAERARVPSQRRRKRAHITAR